MVVRIGNYQVINKVGDLHLVTHVETDKFYLLTQVPSTDCPLLTALHRAPRHASLARLHELLRAPDGRLFALTECPPGGLSLSVRVRGCGPLNERKAKVLTRGLIEALRACHENRITHGTVVPECIMLAPGGMPKLADFREAVVANPGDSIRIPCGPATAHAAPEQMCAKGVKLDGEKVDVWGCGRAIYYALVGKMPDSDAVVRTQTVEFPAKLELSDDAKDLVSRLLHPDPFVRLCLKEAAQHPWLR